MSRAAPKQGLVRRAPGSSEVCRNRAAANGNNTLTGFSDPSLDQFSLSVMGDLHLAPEQMHLFDDARDQLLNVMSDTSQGARIVQLGDLGHKQHKSGSRSCFEFAKKFIDSFTGAKAALILGNHDLEGAEFDEDGENLACWQETFQQPHYWMAEVYICDEQVEWFERQVKAYSDRPVIVFSHAPPIGCGLKVLQNVHVKNRCAWLNHSDRPERFINIVNENPNIKLWFSGHFHLSHNYPDSISTVGSCAFVQTGVIGECNRDGNRHSRVLKGDAEGYKLYTLDHEGDGSLRLDMSHSWSDTIAPVPCVPDEELMCDPEAGWLCSKLDCSLGEDNVFTRWFPVGSNTIIALHDQQLVEYDMATSSPTGVVGKVPEDGSDVGSIELCCPTSGKKESIPRNSVGCFYQDTDAAVILSVIIFSEIITSVTRSESRASSTHLDTLRGARLSPRKTLNLGIVFRSQKLLKCHEVTSRLSTGGYEGYFDIELTKQASQSSTLFHKILPRLSEAGCYTNEDVTYQIDPDLIQVGLSGNLRLYTSVDNSDLQTIDAALHFHEDVRA
eukprot:gene1369-32733_t